MIAVGIPAMAWMWTASAASLIRLVREELPPGSQWLIENGWTTLAQKRNALVEAMLAATTHFSHMLMLDSDMTFPPGMVPRLLAHEKDVVGVLARRRNAPYQLIGVPAEPGRGLLRMSTVGGAVLLIRRAVLECVSRPWFASDPDGGNEDHSFCTKVQAAGFELWADTDLEIGHVTTVAVTPGWHPGIGELNP